MKYDGRFNDIMVTGGAGFIGSHLVRLLSREVLGCIPRVVDDLSRGSESNLDGIECHIERINLSRMQPNLDNVDTMFHLAAKVTGIQYNRYHHYDMMMTNMAINYNVAEAICRYNASLRRVLWVSTACVYPHYAKVPTKEDECTDLCNPEPTNRGYGIAKWVGEQMALMLAKEYDVPMTVVRFFNAIGNRDYYDDATSHVTPALIKRVLSGQNPVVVWGTGKQTRALVDAADISKVLLDLSQCDDAIGQVVNIGHAREVSIEQLARMIIRLAKDKGYIEVVPDLVFDTTKPNGYQRRAADTTKLRNLIGYVPETPLEETLGRMIDEYYAGQ